MQNRESAIRSRNRKRFFHDDLHTQMDELQQTTHELSEQNAGLAAQNALLKK